MEFTTLLDRIDDLLSDGKHVPLSSDVRISGAEIRGLVGQLRGAIPEELKHARWIKEEREEMLAEAQRAAVRMLEEAREERARLLGKEEVARAAEHRAAQLIEGARALERDIERDAERYADEVLQALDAYLAKFVESVERGRERLVGHEAALVA